MHKSMKIAVTLSAVGTLLLGHALAQTPAPATPPASSTKTATSAAKHPASATSKTAAPLTLKTDKEKFSYALGMMTGHRMADGLTKQSVPFDPAILARGLKDGVNGGKTLLTDDEAQAAISAMQKQQAAQKAEANKQAGAANKKAGDDFLAANKGKEGVVTLPSGLQYKILTEGKGAKPTATDSVVCNYRGTLINGTEFDSSYKRGQPATFPVNGVIKGWTEALQLMPVGSKWQLFIPPDLAYGERGAGADIGPDATLIFEVELISIENKSKDEDKSKSKEPEKTPDQPKNQ
jgi:FKBP-type peptidyl-prolyl cis-trans isomerase FklB